MATPADPGYTLSGETEPRMSEKGDRGGGRESTRPDGRLEYEKPAVLWEQPLEARPNLMVGCGKQPGGGGPCDSVGGDPAS